MNLLNAVAADTAARCSKPAVARRRFIIYEALRYKGFSSEPKRFVTNDFQMFPGKGNSACLTLSSINLD
ncbi:hypothetical protein DPMN_097466 [Dreissena polymorpha]|uniref:Uncharacterized protein n=1 Tax=Dreissena polymorpha TaxID=45954 RepID=A0A9D4LDB8_DREPO|nr:hypothetical protein DPMN_097466 [Dreissena polymorpha]